MSDWQWYHQEQNLVNFQRIYSFLTIKKDIQCTKWRGQEFIVKLRIRILQNKHWRFCQHWNFNTIMIKDWSWWCNFHLWMIKSLSSSYILKTNSHINFFPILFADSYTVSLHSPTLIARFMGPTWGPSGADRTQVGRMLAPWTLLSG